MLPPVLLERLRVWWRVARAQGKMPDGGRVFPKRDPLDQLSTRQLNRAIHAAAEAGRAAMRSVRFNADCDEVADLFRPEWKQNFHYGVEKPRNVGAAAVTKKMRPMPV